VQLTGSEERAMNAAMLVVTLPFFSTMIGGFFALRFRNHLHLILGFTAGVLLGVVAFDILPESFELIREGGLDPRRTMVALVAGFLAFHALEKLVLIHHSHEGAYASHHHPVVGIVSALALMGHSFLDGVGIGFAFQVSTRTGIVVAAAIVAHDFADGLNTVTFMLVHENTRRRAVGALLLDAVAPIAGAASTLLVHLPTGALAVYLGFFAGFLLYIGAADILPEAHSAHSSPATVALTCTGALFMFVVTSFLQ
jgi:zinc transporter ZupT